MPNPVIFHKVASQDLTVPFRSSYQGTAVSFSCNFAFEMENTDTGATNASQDYMPYFNHNGIIYPATTANIRWESVTVSFTTKANIEKISYNYYCKILYFLNSLGLGNNL